MKKTILIIDDKVQLCETLTQTFGQQGYQALYATNGQEAIRLFSWNHIHVVLLDIMLGEENGIDILKQLLSFRRNIPVIMITGYASIETAVQSIKLGAFDYVKKPLDFEQLIKKHCWIMNCSGMKRELKNVINIQGRGSAMTIRIMFFCPSILPKKGKNTILGLDYQSVMELSKNTLVMELSKNTMERSLWKISTSLVANLSLRFLKPDRIEE